MTIYEYLHQKASRLNLKRFALFRKLRTIIIPLINDLSKPISMNDNAFKMYTDAWDNGDLLINHTYEVKQTKLINEIMKGSKDAIALDLGANLGYFSLLFAQTCKTVYAFEPEKKNYALLKKNISLNGLEKKIIAEQMAVSDKSGEALLEIVPNKSSDHRIINDYDNFEGKVERVQTITLDKYFKNKKKPDYIKLDIEGHEVQAIKGGTETLKAATLILFEDLTGQAKKEIENLGFKTRQIDAINFYAIKGEK